MHSFLEMSIIISIFTQIEMMRNEISFLCGVGIENVDVVDLETAKHLKKCGFDKPTHWYWQDKTLTFVEKGLKRVKYQQRRMNHNKYDEWIYSAPTKDEVRRWVVNNVNNEFVKKIKASEQQILDRKTTHIDMGNIWNGNHFNQLT